MEVSHMHMNVTVLADAYKLGHYHMSPSGVTYVWDGWTARSNQHMPYVEETVQFGYQYSVQRWLIELFGKWFFEANIDEIEKDFIRKVVNGFHPQYADFTRFRKLYELGYLPLCIMALPEGMKVPIRVPMCVIYNTHPDFAWLPQFLEDLWSCTSWQPSTSATTAYDRRKILQRFVDKTCDDEAITKSLCGDFSFRGLTGIEQAYASSAGHLLSFDKSATFDTIGLIETYYDAKPEDWANVGTPSLEHSVVCQGIAYYRDILENDGSYKGITLEKYADWDVKLVAEMCYLKWLLTELQTTGPLSYVSDTYDFWGVVTQILPELESDIRSRDGILLIRPDSGDPVKICCGDPAPLNMVTHEKQGVVEALGYIFGTRVNKKGFKVIDAPIRVIYGDAITRERNFEIPDKLMHKGYSVENMRFGIGSLSYQYVTRDSRGYALKVTNAVIGGKELPLYKAPKTDDGTKISQKGCFAVHYDRNGDITYTDGLTFEQATNFDGNLLREIFRDGEMKNREDFATIRNRLWNGEF